MIHAQVPGVIGSERVAPPIKRVGPRAFLVVCAIEGLVLAAVLALVLYQLAPQHVPLARSGDYAALREAIWARVNNDVGDPLVEVLPGVSVRESNIRGFSLQGETYYYYFEGQRNFDPLSRGKVDQRGIEIVARDDGGPKPLVIYRLRAG